MNIEPRKQGHDRLSEGQTVFCPPSVVPFHVAFPEIRTIRIEATESGHEVNYSDNKRVYSGSVGEFIACSNAFCNGGFRIAEIIRDMVKRRETHRDDSFLCIGNEVSPKGKRVYKKCMNSLSVVIDIEYHPTGQ